MGTPAAPPSAPAAAPPSVAPPPAAAPEAQPAPPAVATPDAAPSSDAVAPAVPGAPPATPAVPATLEAVKQHFRDQLQGKAPVGEAQPDVPPPVEVQPALEPAPPVQERPPAEPEGVEPLEAAPAEPAEEAPIIELEGVDYREAVLTPEQIDARFARKLSKEDRAEVAQREAHRGELLEKYNKLGGDIGYDVAAAVSEVLWNQNPTVEDVDKLFDQIVEADGAGNHQLFALMSQHLINTQLNDPATGPDFASNMIGQNWGKNPDGTAFDFRGMEPLELVDILVKASQLKDKDGDPIINLDFLKAEVEGNAPPTKTERELELERELEAHKASDTTKAETEEQARTEAKRVYKTQAMSLVSRGLVDAVMPLAMKAGWALGDGEEGTSASEKKDFGEFVVDHVNLRVFGPANAPTKDYEEVNAMIEDGTAYDRETGRPSRRFQLLNEKLQNKAKALVNRKITALQPRIQFTSANSHNASLAKKNGHTTAAQPDAATPPPLATAPTPPKAPEQMTTGERLEAERAKFREAKKRDAEQRQTGVR